MLSRHQAEPSGKMASRLEVGWIARRRYEGGSRDHADTWDCHQPAARIDTAGDAGEISLDLGELGLDLAQLHNKIAQGMPHERRQARVFVVLNNHREKSDPMRPLRPNNAEFGQVAANGI